MSPANFEYAAFALDSEPKRLVADLFHALNQPLTTLCCSLELTLQQTRTPDQYRQSVSQALRQAEKASWLATGIRGLLDAGRVGEDCEVLQLQVAVHLAVGDLLPLASSLGLRLCYLPQASCLVWFEPLRLRQGLFHLLGFVVGSCRRGEVIKIEVVECGDDALLALGVSGDSLVDGPGAMAVQNRPEKNAQESGEEERLSQGLHRRLELGIARATFEAAGGSLRTAPRWRRLESRGPASAS